MTSPRAYLTAALKSLVVLQAEEPEVNEVHVEKVRAIERALRRLEDGTYGACTACSEPISERRLEAIPFASAVTTTPASAPPTWPRTSSARSRRSGKRSDERSA